jgi:hypothetical protein
MKSAQPRPTQTRLRTAIRQHGLDWITALLTVAAIGLTLVALVRAAGAADGGRKIGERDFLRERAERSARVERAFVQRIDGVAADLELYVDNLQAAFDHSVRAMQVELQTAIDSYRHGRRSREFERAVKALDVRLDQLAKSVDRLGPHGLPRGGHEPWLGVPSGS